jgi:hypothetical protein
MPRTRYRWNTSAGRWEFWDGLRWKASPTLAAYDESDIDKVRPYGAVESTTDPNEPVRD